ncbi:hypothetical protein CF8_0647 [Nocardioides sp. CF8]|nr:hypothetical protein CF8_0647 [Nocardioides sp. CF8]
MVCNHEGIKHGELEPAEVVERPEDGRASCGARRELRGIMRCRSGEIRTHPQQRRQPLIGPSAQLVCQRPRGRLLLGRHPFYATRRALAAAHRRRA